ncbi:MAG: ABC transporter ATP-binding protein, partial [bacterium]
MSSPLPPSRSRTTARLWALLGTQRTWLLAGLAGVLFANAGMFALMLLIEPFINALNGQASASALPGWLVDTLGFALPAPHTGNGIQDLLAAMRQVVTAVIVAVLMMAGGMATQTYFIFGAVQRALRDLREEFYRQITRLSLDYFEREQTGQVVGHLTTDLAAVREYLTSALVQLVTHPLVAIGTFILMWVKSPGLTVYSFAILIPLAGLFWWSGKRIRRAGNQSLGRLGDLSTQITETIIGLPVVKAFTREAIGLEQFQVENRAAFRAELTKVRVRSLMTSLSMLLVTVVIGLLMMYGLSLVAEGQLAGGGGALVAFLVLLYKWSDSLNRIGGYWTGYQEMLAAADRIFRFLDAAPTVADPPGALVLPWQQGAVEFDHVRFSYAGQPPWALDDISFTIPPGKTVALVGQSGSGKS